MDPPQGTSYTFSMSSTDAKYVDSDGGYVFQMPNTNLKNAARITLSTLELPLSQFPIEDAFSRVCFSEGIHLGLNSHTIVVTERSNSTQHTGTIELPIQNNDIVAMTIVTNDSTQGYTLDVSTGQPHCLWTLPSPEAAAMPMDATQANLARHWVWGDSIRLVDTALGDVAFDPANLQFVSSTRFRVTGARATMASSLTGVLGTPTGCLHAPPVAGTLFLANIVNMALPYSGVRQIYKVGVDSRKGCLVFTAETLSLPDSGTLQLSISGDGLAAAAGVAGLSAAWQVEHPLDRDDGYHDFAAQNKIDRDQLNSVFMLTNGTDGLVLQNFSTSSHILSGNALQQVMVGKLPIGWYDISNRPVGATNTHRFTNAWFGALQPLLLPPSAGLTEKYTSSQTPLASPYSLQFTDTSGASQLFQVPMGRYTPSTLAATLSTGLTRLSALTNSAPILVSVDRHPNDAALFRFIFQAQTDGIIVLPSPCRFSLQFGMSQIKASTIGFQQINYTGSWVYVSPEYVCLPHLLQPDGTEVPSKGVWSASIIGQQRRMQFSCDPLPYSILLIDVQGSGNAEITLTTGVIGADGAVRPWIHGYVPGDLLQLRQTDSGVLAASLQTTSSGLLEWQENPTFGSVTAPVGCDVGTVSRISAIVHSVPRPDQLTLSVSCTTAALGRSNAWLIEPQVPYPSFLLDKEYYADSIDPCILGLPRKAPSAIGPASFSAIDQKGFALTAIVFGVAGDMPLGMALSAPRIFPLSAWSIYRMDPPEILLIELNDKQMKTNSNLVHISGADIKSTFARINLSSLFREGGLRSDLVNASGDSFCQIKLTLRNPDRSLYQTHNAIWTFTLNVVTA